MQLNCPIIPLLKLHAMNLLLDAAHGVNIVATGMALAQRNVIITQAHQSCFVPLPFWPARILEICSPRLKAWLKSSRVWNSDTKGNHDSTAMGNKMRSPMVYSYILAISWMESHGPILWSAAPVLCLNLAQQGPLHAAPVPNGQHSL